ncbi:hypothetical protein Acor_52310 [Acrocarpospora corrugata]|uniref:Carrier domain-containing protein n=1 Tax=Acrocarpospora corrugata TaxID=35763 RepID=A0A5M3W2A5_9ACTN|nr:hypothetical protein Acor_52310 [Acrocarpospora corrugata]
MLPDEESGSIRAWNDTGRVRPEVTLLDLIREQDPESVAVLHGEQQLTYGALLARARILAGHLRGQGVGPGELVAVCLDRGPDLLAALLGVSMSGAAYLPIDPAYPAARTEYVIADSGARVALTERHLEPAGIPALYLSDVLASGDGSAHTAGAASADNAGDGSRDASGDTARDGSRDTPRDTARDASAHFDDELPAVDPRSPAYVLYTSGSTGRPKGVVVPHRALTNFLLWARDLLDAGPRHVWLALTSLSFDISALELYLPLITGGTCVIADSAHDGAEVARLIRAHGVTHVQATPSGWRVLLTGDLPPVVALTGGEPLPRQLARQLRSRVSRLINVYGPTETTIWSTAWEIPTDPDEIRIGSPIDNTTVHVLDRVGRPAPIGVPGELFIGGTGVADGYLGRPALTAERFVPDPFGARSARLYRTGDVARWRPDGSLDFLGRTDDQVKLRGHRIELGEIEAVLEEHPAVRQAVVLVRGDSLVAFFVGRAGDLREHAARKLPPYMVPGAFVEMDSLPLTPNGKVDRRSLPDAPVRPAPTPPRSTGERLVADVYAEVLGLETVGAHDDFFQLGGTSLTSAAVAGELRRRLELDVPSHVVFSCPTPAALAAWLDDARPATRIAGTESSEYPLSPLQFRLWLSHALTPTGTAYTVPVVLDLYGELDTRALRDTLGELTRRHATLRSVVVPRGGRPFARVLTGPPELTITGCAEDGFDPATDEFLGRPYDLSTDPALRAMLLTTENRHRLVLAIHHLAVDGRSTEIILSELGELYTAHLRRTPSRLTPLPLDFGAAATARDLDEESVQRQIGFWARYLEGATPGRLPVNAAAAPAGVGGQHAKHLAPEVRTQVETLARRCGTTSFVVMLAAFGSVLRGWTGQDDICVGVPVSRRDGADLDQVVGFFVNTVAVRIDTSGDPTFSELVGRLGGQWGQIQANADVPFDQVLAETGLERPFAVWFNHLGAPDSAPPMPGLRTSVAPPPSPPALYDLNVYLTDDGERLTVRVVHDAATCPPELGAALLNQYELRLAELVADPHRRLDKPDVSVDQPSTLATAAVPADEAIRRLSDRIERGTGVIVDDHGVRTSAAVHEDAARIAASIGKAGVPPGGTVAVLSARSRLMPAILLGVWLAGCRYALLDPALPPRRLAACLKAADPGALLITQADRGKATAALNQLGEHLTALDQLGEDLTALDQLGEDLAVLSVAGDGEVTLQGRARATGPLVSPGYVAFTSGTTSGPKAVVAEPGPLAHFLDWYCDAFQLGPRDRFSFLSGLAHDPLHRDLFTPLWCGGALHVPPPGPSTPESLLKWLAAERITVANLTPQYSRLLVAAADASGLRLPDLRLVCLAGDVVTPRDVQDLSRVAEHTTVVVGYGATETPQLPSYRPITLREAEDWAARHGPAAPLPLGSGAPGGELMVTTPSGRPAAVGEVGEVVVRSRHLATGYLDAELTGERFAQDPVPDVRRFRTRDLGRPLPDGTIEYLGRLDDEVKVRGHRVSPAEVDAALNRHPQVRESITLGRRVGQEVELVSYLVPVGTAPVAVDEVRSFLAQDLAAHSLPTLVVHMDELPLTPNGKIDRAALPEPAPRRPVLRPAYIRPSDDLQRQIGDVWAATLRLDRVGVDDNFFDLGGTSVRMTTVHTALCSELGQNIPLLDLYEHPTVRALADHLRGDRNGVTRAQRRRVAVPEDERRRRLAARRGR